MGKDVEVFIEYCKDAKIVVDVGAQKGEFINYANNNMSGGKIYSLEPDPKYYETLQKIQPNSSNEIILMNQAAGSSKGTSKLYNTGTARMVVLANKDSNNYVEVQVDTLDNLFPFEVDLVKVDVEAFEYEVIMGSKTHLKRGTPFLVEIHDKWLREIGKSKDDIIKLFSDEGYHSEFLYRPSHQLNHADLYYYMFTK
tara:strand:+ start:87 stop:677 length:591 start_codon:yes stop_codon:yes gene_type:complete